MLLYFLICYCDCITLEIIFIKRHEIHFLNILYSDIRVYVNRVQSGGKENGSDSGGAIYRSGKGGLTSGLGRRKCMSGPLSPGLQTCDTLFHL